MNLQKLGFRRRWRYGRSTVEHRLRLDGAEINVRTTGRGRHHSLTYLTVWTRDGRGAAWRLWREWAALLRIKQGYIISGTAPHLKSALVLNSRLTPSPISGPRHPLP